MRLGHLPVGLTTALALLGCSPVVDADFPGVEVTRSDIAVPGASSSSPTNVPFRFSVSSGQLGANTDPNAQSRIRAMDLHRLWLTAKSGIADLSFISRLHAVAFVPLDKTKEMQDRTTRLVEIADYERRGDASAGATFEVPLPEPVDLLPLLRPSKPEPATIVISVNLGGELPTVSWTTDVSMVVSMQVHQ
jgi:hypothetical protein